MTQLPDQLPYEFDLDEDEPREQYTGPLHNVVSVSQIKMFAPSAKGCPRKWAMHYLAGFPRPFTVPLRDGVRLHKCLKERHAGNEEWSRKWLSPANRDAQKLGELAVAMARHVPDLTTYTCEPTFFLEVPEIDTAIYIKPDLMTDLEDIAYGRNNGVIKLKDWKSTSALHKRSPWVLQQRNWWPGGELPEPTGFDRWFSLENDIQFRVYAHGLMRLFGGEQVDAEWIYGCKKFEPGTNPKTWTCEATTTRDAAKVWCEAHVWPTIVMMNTLRRWWAEKHLDSILLVPHHPFSCEHKAKFCEDLLGYCRLLKSPVALEKLHLPVIPS